jgi:PadR family transcriptional regulator PadR
MNFLTRKEELILLAVLRLGNSASLVKIREHLVSSTGQRWSVGNVYVPLDRMSRLGYLETKVGDPTAHRGGKAVKYYCLSSKGWEELAELKKVQDTMWAGIPGLVFEKK